VFGPKTDDPQDNDAALTQLGNIYAHPLMRIGRITTVHFNHDITTQNNPK